MKIAMFTDTYPPRINGVATSVNMLRKYFEKAGFDVLIVTTTDPDIDTTKPEHNVIRIPSIPFKTQRLATVAEPYVYKQIREFAPDIIHTHSEFTLGILGRYMAIRLKLPHVHTMHTIWEYYTKHLINIDILEPAMRVATRKYIALICNRADRVIVPTGKIVDLLHSYKVYKEIVVIPTGIETERFAPERCTDEQVREIHMRLGIKPNDKVLINIGRVEKEKNLDELINGLRDYLISHKNVKLLIVGDGTARGDLELLAESLGIGKQIIFAGQCPWDEVNRYYRAGDVFVAASLSETQGLTYVEAMASGLPVVAKRDRCLENVLREGENGFMFDDAASLVSATDTLLFDEEKRRQFSQCAISTAAKLSSKGYADNVMALYNELGVY